MAAKVIPMPQKAGYQSNEVEALLRKWLTEMSTDQGLIDTVAARMTEYIDAYANVWFEPVFHVPVPTHFSNVEAEAVLASIQQGVNRTAEQVQLMINQIILERFFLEIALYEQGLYLPAIRKH